MNKTTQTNTKNKRRREAKTYVGVDISKTELVCDLPEGQRVHDNNDKAIQTLLKRLPRNAHVVCEATGGYEKPLLEALLRAKIPVSCVMSRRVRHYASSQGQMAKNDRIDAGMLSEYGRHSERMRECKRLEPGVTKLRELTRARDSLLEMIKVQANLDEHPATQTLLQKQATQRLAFYRQQLKELEAEIEKKINEDKKLKAKAQACEAIAGVGKVSTWSVLSEMPELGGFERGQAARMLGVAPICQESGSYIGARQIADGRPRPRRVLYMAAISATQYNPIMKAFYLRLRAKGKAPKVALVAVMRKLIERINVLFSELNPP